METLVKERILHLNKHPLGDSNKTDWKGLGQYVQALQGDKKDKEYALKEVGNIFPYQVPTLEHKDRMPNYIPKIKNVIAVQYKGKDKWEFYGHMNIEERAAVIKRYTGAAWQTVNANEGFKYYNAGWIDVECAKYYDGASWIIFYTLIPTELTILRTSSTAANNWHDNTALLSGKFFYTDDSRGLGTTAINTHSHNSVTINFGDSTPARIAKRDSILFERSGKWGHGPHSSISHTAPTATFIPNYSSFLHYIHTTATGAIIPSGSILFWSGTIGNVPSDWTYRSTNNNNMIRIDTGATGANVGGTTGSHLSLTVYSGYTTSSEAENAIGSGLTCNDFNQTHRHSFSDEHVNNHTPSYFNVILMVADSDRSKIPLNGVAAYWDTPGAILGTAYTRVSAADDRLLRPSTAYGTTGGAATHVHTNTVGGTNENIGTVNVLSNTGTPIMYPLIGITHGHLNAGSANHDARTNFPANYRVLLYKRIT